MIAGLELYGLPRPIELHEVRDEEFLERAKKYEIDLSKYVYRGGSGLMFSFYGEHGTGILREPISERIKEEIKNCFDNREEFVKWGRCFDDQAEYIFKPSTDEGFDNPIWDEGNLFTKKFRDVDGRLYRAGGWGVYVYEFDIEEEDAINLCPY